MSCNNLWIGLLLGAGLSAASPQAELGRILFFDQRLSSDGTVSCASCHQPEHAFADPRPVSLGVHQRKGVRNAPTVLNKDRARRFFWDGRAASLEEQARGPLLHPNEMGNDRGHLEARLAQIPEYRPLFEKAFGPGPVTLERITQAIAAYERTLARRDSPFDRWVQGDKSALTPLQEKGRDLFFGKAACSQCHSGADFTNEDFANVGAGKEDPPDEGRRAVTWRASDWRLFKIPSLREVARTAPYMHDGSLKTLEEVVDFYDRGGEVVENKDYRIRPLNLSAAEKPALIAFLQALSSSAGTSQRTPISAPECFPVEALSPEDRTAAEALFLRILDSEGLYTVIGGIKPMSSGFSRFSLDAAEPDWQALNRDRRLLESFRCGDEVFATVHHFASTYPNTKTNRQERAYEGVVFARGPVRQALERYGKHFLPLGITPDSHPLEALLTIEHASAGPRWRGYGLLFGFPESAVDFFVEAGLSQQQTGKFVERDFLSSPTYERAERGVVYAVPKGHAAGPEDERFRQPMAAILAEYRKRRQEYVGEGKPGVAAMLRDWFCRPGPGCRLPAVP